MMIYISDFVLAQLFSSCSLLSSQGCPSWKWFYPFHYAPFASDFIGIKDVRSDFDMGTKPFCPLEQLMGVFPAASGKFLPQTWRTLMSADVSKHSY